MEAHLLRTEALHFFVCEVSMNHRPHLHMAATLGIAGVTLQTLFWSDLRGRRLQKALVMKTEQIALPRTAHLTSKASAHINVNRFLAIQLPVLTT